MKGTEQRLPLNEDKALSEKYTNIFGDLRFGLLLEDLDMLAGRTAIDYTKGQGISIVTAAADRIDLFKPIILENLVLKPEINMVGNTSMEVEISLTNEKEELAKSYFTMVGLDNNFKPTKLPAYTPETGEEKKKEEEAKERKDAYLKSLKDSAAERPFTGEETKVIFEIQDKWQKKKIEGKLMDKTKLQNTLSMYPQNKNMHKKVFGGYVMRLAYELAWDTAFNFCGERPLLVSVDRINFKRPIDIGDLVQFSSVVDYAGNTSISVEVVVEILNPREGKRTVSNNCYFTFVGVDENRKPKEALKVIPYNYEEMVKFVEGYRRYNENKKRKAGLK